MPCRTFEATSIRGTRLNCWKIIAHCDLPGAGLGALQGQHVAAVDQDLARSGVQKTVHHAQEGGFPGARTADDADEGRAVDRES